MTECPEAKNALAPKILMVVAALVLMVSRLSRRRGEYREYLLKNPELVMNDGSGMTMTNGELADISLFKYAVTYWETDFPGIGIAGGTFYAVLCAAPAILAVLSLLLSAFGKPIGNIVVLVLLIAVVAAIVWDFGDRRIVYDGAMRAFGYARYVYYAVSAASLTCSTWLFVEKRKIKKAIDGKPIMPGSRDE